MSIEDLSAQERRVLAGLRSAVPDAADRLLTLDEASQRRVVALLGADTAPDPGSQSVSEPEREQEVDPVPAVPESQADPVPVSQSGSAGELSSAERDVLERLQAADPRAAEGLAALDEAGRMRVVALLGAGTEPEPEPTEPDEPEPTEPEPEPEPESEEPEEPEPEPEPTEPEPEAEVPEPEPTEAGEPEPTEPTEPIEPEPTEAGEPEPTEPEPEPAEPIEPGPTETGEPEPVVPELQPDTPASSRKWGVWGWGLLLAAVAIAGVSGYGLYSRLVGEDDTIDPVEELLDTGDGLGDSTDDKPAGTLLPERQEEQPNSAEDSPRDAGQDDDDLQDRGNEGSSGGAVRDPEPEPEPATVEAPEPPPEAPEPEEVVPPEVVPEPEPEITDISVGLVFDNFLRDYWWFNDSAAAGVERAAAELGITFTEASLDSDGSNRGELLQLAADRHDIVIGVGFLFEGHVASVGAGSPDTMFGVVNSNMLNIRADPPEPYGDNIAGLLFAEHEGSFLVGAAAALKSETGTIGFIGNVANVDGLIERYQAGYEAGARAVDPDIEIFSDYITEAPDLGGFNAPDRAKEIALAMYESGADIVYQAFGDSSVGLFQAALEQSEATGSKVWAIGVNSDQYYIADASVRDYILTSMLKRVDVSVFEMIRSVIEGTMRPGPTTYGLSVDGVGYSTSGGFVDDIAGRLDAIKAQIVSGGIVVPTRVSGILNPPVRSLEGTFVSVLLSAGSEAEAQRARDSLESQYGREFGILLSSDYASLRPGYWVVYAGPFATPEESQRTCWTDLNRRTGDLCYGRRLSQDPADVARVYGPAPG